MNPCYGCKKYKAYGDYLDEILIGKPDAIKPIKVRACRPVEKRVVTKHPVKATVKEKPPKSVKKKTMGEKRCKMGRCEDFAFSKGFCKACYAMAAYYAKQGRPVPTELPDDVFKQRAALAAKRGAI